MPNRPLRRGRRGGFEGGVRGACAQKNPHKACVLKGGGLLSGSAVDGKLIFLPLLVLVRRGIAPIKISIGSNFLEGTREVHEITIVDEEDTLLIRKHFLHVTNM